VFATRPFKKGDFVVEYSGDLIDAKEAKAREMKYEEESPKTSTSFMYYIARNKMWLVLYVFFVVICLRNIFFFILAWMPLRTQADWVV
jgi:hypothetical protein